MKKNVSTELFNISIMCENVYMWIYKTINFETKLNKIQVDWIPEKRMYNWEIRRMPKGEKKRERAKPVEKFKRI